MKWFDKWFSKKVQQAWNTARDAPQEAKASLIEVTRPHTLGTSGMNFTIYRASGGHIVEYRQYDTLKDRHDNKLHIVTDEKDLGEELGKIITFETLRS